MITIQFTLFDKQRRYKPVSCLINVENIEYFNEHKKEVQTQGIIKICQQRGWTQKDLVRYGYTTCKTREYNKTK